MTLRISPSQIRTFRECPRKWGFDKIDKVPREPNKAAAFGTDVHEFAAEHFRGRKARSDDTRIRRVGLALIGAYKGVEEPLVEHYVEVPANGWIYHGYVDLAWITDGRLTIADHKTSRDPDKWGLTAEDLPFDVQAMVYSRWGVELGFTEIDLQWTYVNTQGTCYATPVRATVDRDHVLAEIEKIDVTAAAIVEASKARTAIDLEPEPSACGMYGGCPYAANCPRTKAQILSNVFQGQEKGAETVNLREMIKSKQNGASGANGATKPRGGKKKPPPRPGMDPQPVRDAYEGAESTAETAEPAGTADQQPINAPEVPEDTHVDASREVAAKEAEGHKDAAQDVAEDKATSIKALTPDEVMEKFREGTTTFSVKRGGPHPYTTVKRIVGLQQSGKVVVTVEGDVAYVREADATDIDRDMFKHVVQYAADPESAWKLYRSEFK